MVKHIEKGNYKNQEKNTFYREITKINDNKYIVQDNDNKFFGTIRGFHWNIETLPNKNYKVIAEDIWDLQPFKRYPGISLLTGTKIDDMINSVTDIEVGKALGIGKPLNVKVGFILDKDKKIIKTFGLGSAATAVGLNDDKNNKKQ